MARRFPCTSGKSAIDEAPIWTPTADRFAELARGALIEHLADCVRAGVQPIASGRHARHVLELMVAAEQSAREGRVIDVVTTFE